jgi:hypothetical protein
LLVQSEWNVCVCKKQIEPSKTSLRSIRELHVSAEAVGERRRAGRAWRRYKH